MPKFKPGDRVRVANLLLKGMRQVKVGDTGEVLDDNVDPWVSFDRAGANCVIWGSRPCTAIDQNELELIQPQEKLMKIKGIYKPAILEEEYFVDLRENVCGRPQLVVVDREGNKQENGYILTLHGNGRIQLHERIDQKFGLDLDAKGSIQIDRA